MQLAQEIQVSPDGGIDSLASALSLLRERRRAEGVTPAVIRVRGGPYALSEPLCLMPEDSHLTIAAWPGETPVLDGGQRIDGWQLAQVNGVPAWRADVRGMLDKLGHVPRSFFVNGRRAARPRLPREGYWHSRGTIGSPEAFTLFAGSDQVRMPPECIDPTWRNLTDIDLRVLHLWVDERMPLAGYDTDTHVLKSTHRSLMMLSGMTDGWTAERLYVENVFEGLCEPGQWYLDRAEGVVFYLPLPGEDPKTAECVVPRILQFVRLEGDPVRDRYVQGVRLLGLTFCHSDWVQPSGDWERRFDPYREPSQWHPRDSYRHFVDNDGVDPHQIYATTPQAAHNVPGVIHCFGTRDSALEDCRIEHVGFYGVEIGDGCSNVCIRNCRMTDLGGGGINIDGGNLGSDPRRYTHRNRIVGNCIEQAGRVFHAACGVLLCHGFDHLIEGNTINDLRYTGISIGWEWTPQPHISRNNVVTDNHIHHIGGPEGLSDLGGIYTLGVQPGTVLRGNHIHHVASHAYGGWGIYTDASSAYLLIENNLVHDVGSNCFNNNTGNRENLCRGNVFLGGDKPAINVARRPGEWREPLRQSKALTLVGNCIITRNRPAVSMRAHEGGALEDYLAMIVSDANLWWDAVAQTAPLMLVDWRGNALCDWDAWHEAGHDRHSRANPPDLSWLDPRYRSIVASLINAAVNTP
jgi:hypothetical protein